MTDLRHYETPLRPTAFHARTAALNRTWDWAPWAGHVTAQSFGDAAMEYSAIRNAATLYDLCPMIKYRIGGPEAGEMLDRLTLRRASTLAPGQGQYTAWCDDAGQLLDDGTLFRTGPQEFLLTCQERHLPWLLAAAEGFEAAVADITDSLAALALQGPCSAWVLRQAGFDISELKPFRMLEFPFGTGRLRISRTGFTGDLGYELWLDPGDALALWDALMAAGAPRGITPIGSSALGVARIEAGFLQAQADFIPADQAVRPDRTRSALEMGLGWMIDWTKGAFTGRRALMAEKAAGSRWAFVGLEVAGNVPAEGAILYEAGKREVGVVTSACWSPATKRSIALAQVRRPYDGSARLMAEVYALRELHYAKLMLPARVVDRPFFAPARRRATPPGDV